jgi:hypothetical protein
MLGRFCRLIVSKERGGVGKAAMDAADCRLELDMQDIILGLDMIWASKIGDDEIQKPVLNL